jgi:DnaJ-class molecular chaperone
MSNLINETFQKHLNLLKKHLNEKKSKLLLEINFTVPEAIEVLKSYGVSNAGNLSSDELKKVYRKLASKYHPDSGGSHKDFININSAYETLKKSSSSSSQVPPQSNQQRQQPSNQQSSNQQSSNQQSTSDDLDKEKFRSQYEKQQQEFIAQYEKRQQEFIAQYEKQQQQQQEFIAQYEKRQQEFIAQYEKQQQQQQQELERQKRMRKYQKV